MKLYTSDRRVIFQVSLFSDFTEYCIAIVLKKGNKEEGEDYS